MSLKGESKSELLCNLHLHFHLVLLLIVCLLKLWDKVFTEMKVGVQGGAKQQADNR